MTEQEAHDEILDWIRSTGKVSADGSKPISSTFPCMRVEYKTERKLIIDQNRLEPETERNRYQRGPFVMFSGDTWLEVYGKMMLGHGEESS